MDLAPSDLSLHLNYNSLCCSLRLFIYLLVIKNREHNSTKLSISSQRSSTPVKIYCPKGSLLDR